MISDFGIALAVGVAGGGRLTETGLSLGTPHYMSPEQATGDQTVGAATDIYALGCVLYEMLIGEPPYTGPTAQAVLGQIIAGETASATKKRGSVPANVDAALRRALEKLPADRFASARDFVRALGDAHFRHGELATPKGGGAAGPWNRLTVGLAALASLFAVAFGWSLRRPERLPPVTRFTLTLPAEVSPETAWRGLAVSPDGRTLVFADGPGQLYRRELSEPDAVPIPGTEGAWYPFFSPDGQWVGYFDQGDNNLKKIRVDGGLGQTLVTIPGTLRSAGWGPDGTIVFYVNRMDGLWRIRDTGGEIEQIRTQRVPIAMVRHDPWRTCYSGPRVESTKRRQDRGCLTGDRRTHSSLSGPKPPVREYRSRRLLEGRRSVGRTVQRRTARSDWRPCADRGGRYSGDQRLCHFDVGGDLVFYKVGAPLTGRVPPLDRSRRLGGSSGPLVIRRFWSSCHISRWEDDSI